MSGFLRYSTVLVTVCRQSCGSGRLFVRWLHYTCSLAVLFCLNDRKNVMNGVWNCLELWQQTEKRCFTLDHAYRSVGSKRLATPECVRVFYTFVVLCEVLLDCTYLTCVCILVY